MAATSPAPRPPAAGARLWDADALEAVPVHHILAQDQEYLAKHQLDKLFGGLLTELLKQRPADALQFMIDTLARGPEHAAQDPETGLPQHRKDKLLLVFKIIEKDGSGRISLRKLQAFASKHGGETLTLADLRQLFADFESRAHDASVGEAEFLRFFSRVSATMANREFGEMIKEMQG